MEDHDSPWKGALEEFFDPFLQLLFPEIHQSVDWTRPVRFLDKELQKLRPDSRMGRREVDKLAEVTFHGGTSQTLLIHVEVQGHPDRHFAKRMYLYHTRLRDHFDKPIIDLAVLADTNPKFRPTQFEERIKGKGLRLDFHSVKLLDYEARWEELLQSANPFALIVAAQLTAKREGRQSKHRVDNLLRFYRCAWRMGLSEEQHGRLLVFLDWL
ncbi:MAG TPA: hypothetical protein VNR18_03760, partial [Hyphomicrobiales bacterium]|nr:hypothetical protein [Hyphomicrobiales bacterium]